MNGDDFCEFLDEALPALKMGAALGATGPVPKKAAFALFTARARPAVRAMPRVKIIEDN